MSSGFSSRQVFFFFKMAITITLLLATASLTVTAQQYDVGIDFRGTQNYVTDPAYAVFDNCVNDGITPQTRTNSNGQSVTWQWSQKCNAAADQSTSIDPRLAGVANTYTASGGETLTITVPQAGTYNIGFATGSATGTQCGAGKCPSFIFKDGKSGTQLFTVNPNNPGTGRFIDAANNNWTAAQWPASNQEQTVTLTGTTLTVSMAAGNAPSIAHIRITSVQQQSFSLSASPASLSIQQGNQGTSTITATISGGFNSAISLSASGAPSGTTVSFNPNPIPAPGAGSSTMTITVGSSTPTGTYPITVTGNGGGVQQNTTVTLTVTAGAQPNFTISALPASLSIAQGNQGTSTITATISGGFNSAIGLSASGVPSGTTVGFNPNPIPAPGAGSSTMTITVGSSTPTGTYPITVTGNGGGIQQNTTVTLTVTPAPNFTISASPASLSIAQGNQGTSTITTTISGGFNSAISLSASGAPSGTTVSFNPNPIPAPGSGSSTMTITVGSSTPTGTYPITVTGNGGGIQQSTNVSLTVTGQASAYDVGIDFRGTQNYVTDPAYAVFDNCINDGTNPQTRTNANGQSISWQWSQKCNTAADQSNGVDPRLAGIANTYTGSGVETLTITVPQPGTYNIGFATGSATGNQCGGGKCPNFIFKDGASGTQLFTVNPNNPGIGHFIDAGSNNWTAAQWPSSNQERQATLTGTTLTVSMAAGNAPSIVHIRITSTQQQLNLSASPASLSIQQGNQGTSTITTTVGGGFNSAISLSASGLPLGTTVSFNPNPLPAPGSGTSTMTISVGSSTPTGTYPITVSGNGGGIQQSTTVTLTVTAAPFTISASPASVSIPQGDQAISTITTTITGGFNNAIGLSASGMPSGTTVSFNPNPIPAPGAGNSTMTIVVGGNTPTGTYPITVTGNGGGMQQNATVTLTVFQSGGQVLSSAYIEQSYSFTLQSSFGTPPYTYQLESGSLPPGLNMDQSGDITGVPTATGQFPFEVLVTDSSQPQQQQTYNYTLNVLVAVATYHNDSYRSGANINETVLTASNVNVQTFGKRSVFSVQGYVYAQPLYVPGVNINGTLHNLVLIATEHDQVYAFDVNSGQQIWQTSFLSSSGNITISSVSSNDVGCGDLTPEIGITGTPAIDTATGTVYLVAKTKQYNSQTQKTTFYQTLHALDIVTGLDKVAPQQITATAPGTGTGSLNGVLTFDPLVQAQRPGLLIQNGTVFIAFASHCDLGAYHGWIMAFAENTLAPSGVTVDTPNGYEGGYWGGGSGLNADSAGSIYGATGNGYFDVDQGGIDYGDSILRLTWSAASKTFTVADYFTPWDQLSLDHSDADLGSGGVLLLPDQPGTTYPHLLVQAGKEGTIDLVNRDNMGHFHSGNDSQIVQTIPYAIGGIWGAPAFWNNRVYFGGVGDYLKAFSFDPNAQQLSVNYASKSPESFGYPGPTPSVSANGNANGIVWIIENDTYGGGAAVLRAYDATNLGKELYNSGQNPARDRAGLAVKFTVPTVADGHVFLGAENEVDVYGPLQ